MDSLLTERGDPRKQWPDLFGHLPPVTYPEAPGHKAPGPSAEAGAKIAPLACRLRRLALAEFGAAGQRGLTADECAKLVGYSILAIRPRCSELRKAGYLEPTTERRPNDSSLPAGVLRITAKGMEAVR